MRATGGSQQFGDTTLTKVFVGGLAWETQRETVRHYFEQFGEILEAVVITDKNTGRSKGYGFVSFFFLLWVLGCMKVFNFLSDLHGSNCLLFWGADWSYGFVLLFSCGMGLGDLPRSRGCEESMHGSNPCHRWEKGQLQHSFAWPASALPSSR